jgi:hypothetical protein
MPAKRSPPCQAKAPQPRPKLDARSGYTSEAPPSRALAALTNVAKHAIAAAVRITVERHDGRLLVEVADDGPGGATIDAGSGLRGLSDRVAALDGRLKLQSPAGGGTRVGCEFAMRVAIADDAVLFRAGVASRLTNAGITVTASVGSAEELLREVERDPPDAAIVDIRRPRPTPPKDCRPPPRSPGPTPASACSCCPSTSRSTTRCA